MKITKSRLLQIIKEEISRIEEADAEEANAEETENIETTSDEEKEWNAFMAAHKNFIEATKEGSDATPEEIVTAKRERDKLVIPIFNTAQTKVLGYIKRKDPNNAEDHLQDTFVKIFKILEEPENFEKIKGKSYRAFLKTAVKNKFIDFTRRRERTTKSGDTTTMSDLRQSAAMQRGDGAENVEDIGKGGADIAGGSRVLARSPEKIAITRQQLERALNKLKKNLKDVPKFSKKYLKDEQFDKIWDEFLIPYFVNTTGEGGKGKTSGGTRTKLAQEIQSFVNKMPNLEGYKLTQGEVSKALIAAKAAFDELVDPDQLKEISMPTAAGGATAPKYTDKTTNDKKPNPPTKSTLEKIIKEVLSEML